jgi:rhodanese-related sulfurtransferase
MKSAKKLVDLARESVPAISPEEALRLIDDPAVLLVDVREAAEVEKTGLLQGAVHVTRGMLEFRADPESPSHDRSFSRDKTVILYCASGGRSALAGQTLQQMGYGRVMNLGGFRNAVEGGFPVDEPS